MRQQAGREPGAAHRQGGSTSKGVDVAGGLPDASTGMQGFRTGTGDHGRDKGDKRQDNADKVIPCKQVSV